MVVGAELFGDQVGIFELVTLVLADLLETDAERLQSALALLGEQGDDQRRVHPAGEQDATGTSATIRRWTAVVSDSSTSDCQSPSVSPAYCASRRVCGVQ